MRFSHRKTVGSRSLTHSPENPSRGPRRSRGPIRLHLAKGLDLPLRGIVGEAVFLTCEQYPRLGFAAEKNRKQHAKIGGGSGGEICEDLVKVENLSCGLIRKIHLLAKSQSPNSQAKCTRVNLSCRFALKVEQLVSFGPGLA